MTYLFPYPEEIDTSQYSPNKSSLKAFYGLPQKVSFCKCCVISNQRPSTSVEFKNDGEQPKDTINFNEDGICDACLVKRDKKEIDWKERELELRDICDQHRSKTGAYDCLVPGSGGKDSFMTAHLLKYKYGMNPLTCTWAPHIYTDWGWKNFQAWIDAGFDNILYTPNSKVHRIITRLSTEKLFYPFQPFILGQKNMPPKIAAKFGIDLIFYGENQAEYGNPKSTIKSPNMSSDFYSASSEDKIYLGGASLSELREIGLTQNDWNTYLPIDSETLKEKKIEYHYLGYYEKWHPQGAFYYAVENGNFQSAPERTAGTYNTYNSIDDKLDDFHYHTTFIKFGIGRASYDASQEIRSGDLNREEGIALVKKFDGEFPERWAKQIFNYLSLPEEEFNKTAHYFENPIFDSQYYERLSNKFRSPHLWEWSSENGWELRHKIFTNEIRNSQEQTAAFWEGNK